MIINNRPSGGCSYIVDQGWSLHVGSVRLARWRRCYADARIPSLQPVRFWSLLFSGRAALGAGVTCLGMFAATNLIVERVWRQADLCCNSTGATFHATPLNDGR